MKENFLQMLQSMTPAEINKVIEEKGKERKLIKVMFTAR